MTVFEVAKGKGGGKGHLPLVSFTDPHQIVCTPQIQFHEDFGLDFRDSILL